MKLSSIALQEAKQVGILYHFTPYVRWERIKKSDMLKGSAIEQDLAYFFGAMYNNDKEKRQELFRSRKKHTPTEGYYVSTTRNKALYKNFNLFTDFNPRHDDISSEDLRIVRIVIDGDALSNNYKIIPYNYFINLSGKDRRNLDEDEERVVLPEGKPYISNIKKYVARVDLLSFSSMFDKSPKINLDFEQV